MRRTALAALLFVLAPGAWAQLYKCVQDGRTVYQQERCPDTAKQSTLRAPEGPAVAPAVEKERAEQQAKSDDADLDRLADTIAGYNICSELNPDFRTKHAEAYNGWGGRNAEAFKKYNASPEAQEKLKRQTAAARARLAGEGLEAEARKAALCAQVLGTIQSQ